MKGVKISSNLATTVSIDYMIKSVAGRKGKFSDRLAKLLLHNHNLKGIAWNDVITFISINFEL
jgi:hypothetical protein